MNWKAVAPIIYEPTIDTEKQDVFPIKISDTFNIIHLPDQVKSNDIIEKLNCFRKDHIKKDCDYAFVYDYECDSLGDLDNSYPEYIKKTKQEAAFEQIELFNICLWISKPSQLTFNTVIDFAIHSEEWIARRAGELVQIRTHPNYQNTLLSDDDLQTAIKYYFTLTNESFLNTTRIALSSLFRALTEENPITRYLFLWISIEALFGPDDGREINFRLAQRIALFLSNYREKKETFKLIKKRYSYRSKIVHGLKMKPSPNEDFNAAIFDIEMILRDSFVELLNSDDKLKVFSTKDRELFLDSLAFG